MCENRFYICRHCGNIVGKIHDSGVPIICCGEPMQELVPGSVDASLEKHVPAVEIDGNTVRVKIGSAPHPMTEEHHIAWVYLETEHGGQRKCLALDAPAEASFTVIDDKPVAVFAYCNLHGLWKKEL